MIFSSVPNVCFGMKDKQQQQQPAHSQRVWTAEKKGRKKNDATSDVTCKITSIRLTLYRVFIFTHFFLLCLSLALTHSDVLLACLCACLLCPSIRFHCITIFNVNMLGSSVDRVFVCATKRLNNGQTLFYTTNTHSHTHWNCLINLIVPFAFLSLSFLFLLLGEFFLFHFLVFLLNFLMMLSWSLSLSPFLSCVLWDAVFSFSFFSSPSSDMQKNVRVALVHFERQHWVEPSRAKAKQSRAMRS